MGFDFINTFKIASIFIGTVVGAGLASGKEIYQFFSVYGLKSFLGFIICFIMYVIVGNMICNVSSREKLSSYSELINEVCPRIPAKVLNIFTSLYYLFSSSIIFAASGSLISEFFSVHKLYGVLLMIVATLVILKFSMNGLFLVNAITVPAMISVIFLIFILSEIFSPSITIQTSLFENINSGISMHKNVILSSFLYGGFNILSASGVLAPLSVENKKTSFRNGILIGSFFLVIMSMVINYMILNNMPYIAGYDIPLLYIAKIFGKGFQVVILILIWCEMLSTETSSMYSLAKSLSLKLKCSFSKCIFIIMGVSIPISIFGFSKLIAIIYPMFGLLSFIFIFYIARYELKKKREKTALAKNS